MIDNNFDLCLCFIFQQIPTGMNLESGSESQEETASDPLGIPIDESQANDKSAALLLGKKAFLISFLHEQFVKLS